MLIHAAFVLLDLKKPTKNVFSIPIDGPYSV